MAEKRPPSPIIQDDAIVEINKIRPQITQSEQDRALRAAYDKDNEPPVAPAPKPSPKVESIDPNPDYL